MASKKEMAKLQLEKLSEFANYVFENNSKILDLEKDNSYWEGEQRKILVAESFKKNKILKPISADQYFLSFLTAQIDFLTRKYEKTLLKLLEKDEFNIGQEYDTINYLINNLKKIKEKIEKN